MKPDRPLGRRWAAVSAIHRRRRTEHNQFRTWPISALPDGRQLAPPLVYVAIDTAGTVMYVGQTRTGLRERFQKHLRDPVKAHNFASVAAIQLQPETSAVVVDQLERAAHIIMQPALGKARPRSRD